MATVKIVDLIARAEVITQDKTSVRWPKQEWLDWYNDAILAVINTRPDASILNTNLTCTASQTKQSLPADALRLMTVVRNASSGIVVRQITRAELDDQVDAWHTHTGNDIHHYVYDERDPKHVYVYPAPTAANHDIEIIYSTSPAKVLIGDFDTDDQTLSVDDNYSNAILDFMLYRAYLKDADYAENGQRAMSHLEAHNTALGIKSKSDAAMASQPKA